MQINNYHIKPTHRRANRNSCQLKVLSDFSGLPQIYIPFTSQNPKANCLSSIKLIHKMADNQASTNHSSVDNSKLSLHPQVSSAAEVARQEQRRYVIKKRIRLDKLGEVPSKLKEKVPKCVEIKHASAEHKIYKVHKYNIRKNNPSAFQLPTEESYNNINELFYSIKNLLHKHKGKGSPKERISTARTNSTEEQTQEFYFNCNPKEPQETSIEEDLLKLEELKKGIKEGENIELVPSLKRDYLKVKMAVADIIFVQKV